MANPLHNSGDVPPKHKHTVRQLATDYLVTRERKSFTCAVS